MSGAVEGAADRATAIAGATARLDDGRFQATLAELVAHPTESQGATAGTALDRYLDAAIAPRLERLGFTCTRFANPAEHPGGFLVAVREEDPALPTVLTYGHGDVVHGDAEHWSEGLGPWCLVEREGRWYGRGTADNKGQHLVNLEALAAVLEIRGRLGFNVKVLMEMGEEAGSPGLDAFCAAERERLRADLLIAADGPRLRADVPTVFMGSRGVANLDLEVDLRAGGHHSGNWGGVLANPGTILAGAIASIVSATGQIRVVGWRPPAVPRAITEAVRDLRVGEGADVPALDAGWGEPGQTPGERVFAWPSFEVLAFLCGNPQKPQNAIPPKAVARCQLRFTPPLTPERIVPALRTHLDERGFRAVRIAMPGPAMAATRLPPDHRLVRWAAASIEWTTGKAPTLLPNLGGSLPNAAFAETLGLPTLWVPHSYAGCNQHAADEHALPEILREGLALMAGLWWDLGEGPPGARAPRLCI